MSDTTGRSVADVLAEALYLAVAEATADHWTEWIYLTDFKREQYMARGREVAAALAAVSPDTAAPERTFPCPCSTPGETHCACSHHTAAPVDATRGGHVTPRFALSYALVGENPYDRAAYALERLAAIGWTVAPVDQRAAVDHAKIEAVRALHSRRTDTGLNARNGSRIYSCSECGKPAPCPTIRALDDATTTRPPPCPSQWANNRGVHCAEREGHPGQHGNGVVSWSEAEAAA